MYSNLLIDFGVGLVPVIGDFADAWFKCNTRNNILLEKYLRERGQKHPAPPPVQPQQHTKQRWFGAGPHAAGSHSGGEQPIPLETSPAAETGYTVAASNAAPALPPRHGDLEKYGVVDRGANVVDGRNRDLEAQNYDGDVIHYRREQ
jgi:hypothetical protein